MWEKVADCRMLLLMIYEIIVPRDWYGHVFVIPLYITNLCEAHFFYFIRNIRLLFVIIDLHQISSETLTVSASLIPSQRLKTEFIAG